MSNIMTAIYGGGPFYSGGAPVFDDLKASGFTTVVELIHLGPDATIQLAPQILVQDGAYVGDAAWPGQLADLKTGATSINRLLFCLGGAAVGDFKWIKNLVESEGAGPGSRLYTNFQALKAAIPALDGIDLDDETTYDPPSTIAFCQMLQHLGYQVTFCPYTRQDHWLECLAALNGPDGSGAVTGFNLQCYDGGGSNQPQQWIDAIVTRMGAAFPAASFVYPGLWCRNKDSGCQGGSCPSDVYNQFAAWRSTEIGGGFIWLYDDIQYCLNSGTCQGNPMNSPMYSGAIVAGLTQSGAETARDSKRFETFT
jgi:hypothetical protein